jgi:hypothetical protein
MIIPKDDFLFKVVVESTFNFANYFLKNSYSAQWIMDYEQTTTHINNHKQPTHKIKTTYSQEQCRI